MVLKIVTYPNEVLRQPAARVVFPLSKDIVKLTKDMMDTVKAADGIGLAAPQVGRPLRLVVINMETQGVPLFPLYNPKIITRSFKKVEVEEGCLSLPGIFGMVRRPRKVTIEAQNSEGEKIRFTDDGWIARVAQHEIDHVNGVLLIDHAKKYTQGGEIVRDWKKRKIL